MHRDTLVFPVSYAQERLWFLDQLEPGSPAYNIVAAYRLSGPLDVDVLEQALQEVVCRHEALRTTFTAVDGQPVQVIHDHVQRHSDGALAVVDLAQLERHSDGAEAEARRLMVIERRTAFNLEEGPLLRPSLLRLGAEDHILLLTVHHIVTDGWSMGVLRRELSVLYSAFLAGAASPLVELEIQYADYAEWQRDWLQGEVLGAQLEYWQKQLAGAPPTLSLPTDRLRPPVQSSLGAKESVLLPKALTEALKGLSKGEGVTLFMTLLAAFKVLLYRYSGQEDLVVGTAVANRNQREIEPLIGFFVNTLALRTNLSGNPTFRQLLGQVREVCLGAYAHQDLPFERLVKELNPERDLSRNPLVQVMFILQNVPPQALALTGLDVHPVELEEASAGFDLSLNVTDTGEALLASVVYNTDLFDRGTLVRMLGHLQRLLEGVVADPDQKLSDLPLLTPEERHQLLVAWNDTGAEYPQGLCVHQLFERQVQRTPQAIAVVFEDQRATYQELNAMANRLAHQLLDLGIGPDTVVGLLTGRSLAWAVGLLGILKAGAAFLPLDATYPEERLAFILADARVPVVVTSPDLASKLPRGMVHPICLDAGSSPGGSQNEANPETGVTPAHLAYVIYTSGTTGQPKGVLIQHRGLCNLIHFQISTHDLAPGDIFLHTLSLGFDASIGPIMRSLCAGATLHLANEEVLRSGADIVQLAQDTKSTHLNMVPSLLELLPEHRLPSVRVVVVGGEACPAHLVTRWAPGRKFFNAYGPTEATIGSTLCECTANSGTPPIGRPIANMQLYILDRHLNPVPIGVPGEIYLAGIGLARGYLDRPELTAQKFIPNPYSTEPGARLYRTGDLGRYRPDGNIEFLGRTDHQVKLRGYRIELGDIEAVLAQHEGVREAVAMVRGNGPGGQRLVAYVVAGREPALTAADLQAYLRQKLPEYMVPVAYVVLDALPLTSTGKVDRQALPAPDWSQMAVGLIPPRTPVEKVVAGIWAEVLGLERVGIDDNFFDLGGHSLLATQIISRLRSRFQVEIPLRALFERPTVAGLAQAIEQAGQAGEGAECEAIPSLPRRVRRGELLPPDDPPASGTADRQRQEPRHG